MFFAKSVKNTSICLFFLFWRQVDNEALKSKLKATLVGTQREINRGYQVKVGVAAVFLFLLFCDTSLVSGIASAVRVIFSSCPVSSQMKKPSFFTAGVYWRCFDVVLLEILLLLLVV